MIVSPRWFAPSVTTAFLVAALGVNAQERPLDAKLQTAFDKEQLSGLHNVLVIHNGEILAERHFRGPDRRIGQTWSMRTHGPETLHALRSITKSVVGLLYGIALAEDKVPDLSQGLLSQFPEYPDLVRDPERATILVRHALSMTLGTAWNEDVSYYDRKNSARLMSYENDQHRYVLDRPIVGKPGKSFVYNSGAAALVARLIERGVGMSIDRYAEAKLFKPLGIHTYEWVRGASGAPILSSGLRLNVHDLAKIGQLVLQQGGFHGHRIVPADWLEESFKPRSTHENGLKYGYLWSLVPNRWKGLPDLVVGIGNGGQTLAISLEQKLIVVIFAGNYNNASAGKLPREIITNFVVPALETKLEK